MHIDEAFELFAVGVNDIVTFTLMNRNAASKRDVAYDVIARNGLAAFGNVGHKVADAMNGDIG